MDVFFVSGSDTGVGKTFFMRHLAHKYVSAGRKVQVVKIIETGVREPTDAPLIIKDLSADCAQCFTLNVFSRPIAPVEAAAKENVILSLERLLSQYFSLLTADIRLVEGAGGLAVPIQHSPSLKDWADFVKAINVKMLYLVVENRLGAIHHIRVLDDYVQKRGIKASFVLNTIRQQSAEVLEANRNIFLYTHSPLYSTGFSG